MLVPIYLIIKTTLSSTNRVQLQIRSSGSLWMWENNAAQLHRRSTSPQFWRDLGARRTTRIAWFRCARTPDWLYATGELFTCLPLFSFSPAGCWIFHVLFITPCQRRLN